LLQLFLFALSKTYSWTSFLFTLSPLAFSLFSVYLCSLFLSLPPLSAFYSYFFPQQQSFLVIIYSFFLYLLLYLVSYPYIINSYWFVQCAFPISLIQSNLFCVICSSFCLPIPLKDLLKLLSRLSPMFDFFKHLSQCSQHTFISSASQLLNQSYHLWISCLYLLCN